MTRRPHKTPPAQPYQYNELPRDGSFRYIVLHRGIGNDPLKCSLQTAPLAKTTFEAISYVWGKSKKNKKIICDGRVIRITKSLSNVLRRLRLPHKRRKLWADGICINQDDLEEKGHQVAIMGDIYRSAKCVLIYIGSEDNGHGPLACSLVDDVNRMIDETFKHFEKAQNVFPYPKKDDALLSDSRWSSLLNLFRQSWFKRSWVVREAAVAQCHLVIWHDSEFSWKKLMRSFLWLVKRGTRIYYDANFTSVSVFSHSQAFGQRDMAFIETLFEGGWPAQSLLSRLSAAKTLKVSDARDRIYAHMELSDGNERVVTMNPDYHLATLDVYHQFAVDYIEQTKDIQILDHVCHVYYEEFIDIPSWVPRWDVSSWSIPKMGASRWSPARARDGSICEPEMIDHSTLLARGVIVDSVLHVSDMFNTWDTAGKEQQIVSELWRTISQTLDTSPYGASEGMNAFLCSLSCGKASGIREEWLPARAALIAHGKALQDGSVSGELFHHGDPSSNDFNFMKIIWDQIWTSISKRRFIVTRRGYMGLAPAFTQADDLCAIIFGCEMPCILRPTDGKQFYNFLGATYLMGADLSVYDGEMLFACPLGHDNSKEWVDWDVEEQDICLD